MKADGRTDHVFTVGSLEEAELILAGWGRSGLPDAVLAGLCRGYAFIGNILLAVFKRILFPGGGGSPARICVYTVGIVGDNVVMLPALAALRAAYPAARIDIVTNHQCWDGSAAAGVLASSPFKDGLVLIDNHPVVRRGAAFLLDRRLGELRCDLFVNLSPFGNRGLLGAVAREMIFAKKIGASRAVGFRLATWSRGRTFDRVQERLMKNEPRRGRAVLAELGLIPREGEDLFPAAVGARELARDLLRHAGIDPDRFAVLHPGAKFAAKCWPAERFASTGRRLADEFGFFIAVTGSSEERSVAAEVALAIGAKAANLAGETGIPGLVELLRLAKLCVANDTGVMHLAAMTGTPTVAIFSARHSPLHWLPLGATVVSLFSLPECRACYDDACTGGGCLASITVEQVWRAVERARGLGEAAR